MTWQWKNDSNFVNFDSYTSGLIETAKNRGQTELILSHGFFAKDKYKVDFKTMKQINMRTNFGRDIKKLGKQRTPIKKAPQVLTSALPTLGKIQQASGPTKVIAVETNRSKITAMQAKIDALRAQLNSTSGDVVDVPPSRTMSRFNNPPKSMGGWKSLDGEEDSGSSWETDTDAEDSAPENEATQPPPPEAFKWQYSDLASGWIDYDVTTQGILEAAFNRKQKTVQCSHGFFARDTYTMTIIGSSLTQKNNKTNNSRTLRRNPPQRTTPYNAAAAKPIVVKKKLRKKIKKKKVGAVTSTVVAPAKKKVAKPSAPKKPKTLKEQFAVNLGETFDNKDFVPDVKFVFDDGKEIYAHKIILSARKISGAFDLEKYYEGCLCIIDVVDWHYEEFRAFLEILYSGRSHIPNAQACENLGACARYFHHDQIYTSTTRAVAGARFPCYITYHATLTLPEKACLLDYSDCTIVLDRVRIPAHRVVICAMSSYFKGMFMRGTSEAISRVAEIKVPWDPATFGTFLKALYCYDVSVALEIIPMFKRDSVDIQQLMLMTDMYAATELKGELTTILSEGASSLGLGPTTLVSLFGLLSRAAVQTPIATSKFATVEATYTHMGGSPLKCYVYFESSQAAGYYYVGASKLAMFKISKLDLEKSGYTIPPSIPKIDPGTIFTPYNEEEKRLLNTLLESADVLASAKDAEMKEWPEFIKDGLLLYCGAETGRARSKPWAMMTLASRWGKTWAVSAYELICTDLIAVENVSSILVAAVKCGMTDLEQLCVNFIVKELPNIADYEIANPDKLAYTLRDAEKANSNTSNAILNKVRVGSAARKSKGKCDLCLKTLKKGKKSTCPVCQGSICTDDITTKSVLLPAAFSSPSPVFPCVLCLKILRASYTLDDFTKFDPRSKAWNIVGSKLDPPTSLEAHHYTEYQRLQTLYSGRQYDLSIIRVSGEEMAPKDSGKSSDPYYVIQDSRTFTELLHSEKRSKTLNPIWDDEENLLGNSYDDKLYISFYDHDTIGKDEFMGCCELDPVALRLFADARESDYVNVKFLAYNPVNIVKGKKKMETVSGTLLLELAITDSNPDGEKNKNPVAFV
eukprot:TRINITY_DN2751_c0_g1_i1.p1 TRINITY_DN2751_c0_g1~~TRINITY_DN2751_c0_g1_i1.p1  ORF type:complete len:1087 (+),score=258.36 TRINITY_DN2751_c0_g1_i1:80-3340(+)